MLARFFCGFAYLSLMVYSRRNILQQRKERHERQYRSSQLPPQDYPERHSTPPAFTLGNYLGAVKNWRRLQEEYDCYYFVADLHALTVYQDPATRRKASRAAFALLLACGLDPTQSLVFIQSHVLAHAQMGWMLSCLSPFGDLAHDAVHDKSAKHPEDINAGLYLPRAHGG